ncbi:MAG: PIN domain-containing protein [Rhodospirillales bacterium]|nr:PIN domain-containing protein [Rhodospirillales bacterium]
MPAYRYLLDTNIVSDLVRNPQGSVMRRIARVGEHRVCTSIIVACELCYGAEKKGSTRLSAQLEQVLSVLPVLPLDGEADRHYGKIRADRGGTIKVNLAAVNARIEKARAAHGQ